jgi:hypothetical protein
MRALMESPHAEATELDRQLSHARRTVADVDDDPVPPSVVLTLEEVFRVLDALEDSLNEFDTRELAPGLRDELATVIALLHRKLGFDAGGAS